MRDTVFVSVVLPVYNESDRIEAVLLSLFNQHTKNELITHDTYELIVVDNNSTDDSVAKINAFSERHPAMAIHVIAETVQGVSSARKRGMDYASLRSKARDSRLGNKRKHYIVSADADCTVDAFWLYELVNTMIEQQGDLGTCNYYYPPAEFEHRPNLFREIQKTLRLREFSFSLFGGFPDGKGFGVERSLYDAVGGIEIFYQLNHGRFVEHLSDDWDFGIKVIAYGGKPVYARHAYVEINSRRVDTILDEVINGIAYGKDGIIIMKDVRPDVERQKTALADATSAEAKLAWDYSVKDFTPKNILLPVLLNPYLLLENSEVRDFFSGPLADSLYRRIHELKHEMRLIDFKPIHAYKTPAYRLYLEFRDALFAAMRRAVGDDIGFPPALPACFDTVKDEDFTRFVYYFCEDRESGEAHNYFGNGGGILMNDEALHSLLDIDENYPTPRVNAFLAQPENRAFLEYVHKDPFGCHVFPGDLVDYPLAAFFADMEADIRQAGKIHLWAYIPTCRYRCHFCQYPTVILNPKAPASQAVFRDLVDFNIKEAQMWLARVPSLAEVEIGEFNVFGGTPSLLPEPELRRMMAFYFSHFNFTNATLRFEGEPGTLNKAYLALLKELGFSKISFGTQSFNDDIITACGRMHSAEECVETIHHARALGIDWVSVDLIYGMLGQSVDDVKYDMEKTLELNLSHVVCTKLHMDEFIKNRTGVSGERESLWQKKGLISINNLRFPGLGKQYQMRELVENYLNGGYTEHPTMYFHRNDQQPEKWKALITDLDKQYPEVAIGLGGSSKSTRSEAINITGYKKYKEALNQDRLPIEESRGFSPIQREVNAFKMALSTLLPVDDRVFKRRFDGNSLFANPVIRRTLKILVDKALVTVDGPCVTLTPIGVTLVEAIINTQFSAAFANQE